MITSFDKIIEACFSIVFREKETWKDVVSISLSRKTVLVVYKKLQSLELFSDCFDGQTGFFFFALLFTNFAIFFVQMIFSSKNSSICHESNITYLNDVL